MLASIVVRTKIAKFGPGQFKFVLAKTEIAVFGLRQHHQHVAGKDFAVFLPEHVLRLRLEHGLGLFGARLRRDSFEIAVKASTFAV